MQTRSELIMEHPGAEIVELKYGANAGVDNLVIYRDENGATSRASSMSRPSRALIRLARIRLR
jgi:hypothetical protein